jgi:hypothetical protein
MLAEERQIPRPHKSRARDDKTEAAETLGMTRGGTLGGSGSGFGFEIGFKRRRLTLTALQLFYLDDSRLQLQ